MESWDISDIDLHLVDINKLRPFMIHNILKVPESYIPYDRKKILDLLHKNKINCFKFDVIAFKLRGSYFYYYKNASDQNNFLSFIKN